MAYSLRNHRTNDGRDEPKLNVSMRTVCHESRRYGFTLIELLVTVVVLVILMAILASVTGTASRLTDTTNRNIDSSSEAEQVLDRIGQDVAGMISRPDVDQYYVNSTGNDQFFFYCQTPGYFSNTITTTQQSPVSLIGFRISTTANSSLVPSLERATQGLTWSASVGSPFLVFPTRTSVTQSLSATVGTIPSLWGSLVSDPDTAPSFWHAIGTQVFRLEICYQLRDGTFTLTPPSPSSPPATSTGTTSPPPPVPGSVNDTTGLVVAIALLDTKSRQIMSGTSWKSLIAALPDPSQTDLTASPTRLMESLWNAKINQASFASVAGIPPEAAAQVRIYQRFYALGAPYAR